MKGGFGNASELREVEPSSTAQILDINEILHQTFDNAVGIGTAAEEVLSQFLFEAICGMILPYDPSLRFIDT